MKRWMWVILFSFAIGTGLAFNFHYRDNIGDFDLIKHAEYSLINGNYRSARTMFYLMAWAGNSDAQCMLAELYLFGDEGTTPDYAKALAWVQKSVGQGNSHAQTIMSIMYGRGMGVPKDPVAAFQWMHKAAEQNWIPADVSLARMYEEGTGVPRDYTRALALYLKAQNTRGVRAPIKLRIGQLYESGLGTQKDPIEAYKWYKLAATDKKYQPVAHQAIERLRAEMNPAQIAEGQKRVVQYIKSHPVVRKVSSGAQQ